MNVTPVKAVGGRAEFLLLSLPFLPGPLPDSRRRADTSFLIRNIRKKAISWKIKELVMRGKSLPCAYTGR